MDGRIVLRFAGLLCTLLAGGLCAVASAADPPPADSMQEDAELSSVAFVDARRGWAVGDRGVIWRTVDAGASWQVQNSGVTCALAAVQFIDDANGWAAGGLARPGMRSTQGVLLRTRDGGRTWGLDQTMLLGAIRQIKFFGPTHGLVVGDASAVVASGLSFTETGGRTWTPIADGPAAGWIGDFADPATGLLVGRQGGLRLLDDRKLVEAEGLDVGLRLPRAVRLDGTSGWLVGDGGLLLATNDGGRQWRPPAAALPPGSQRFDWRALEVRGPHCWIAGAPGTRVLYSGDSGASWQSFATGQTLPIRAITFADPQHGWAVGALGTILATTDGGQTWRRQRGGGSRAALLAVYSDARRVPLEAVARLAANDGFLTTVELLNRRDVESGTRSVHSDDRDREAMLAVGCSAATTAWAFPLRQTGLEFSAEQIVAAWDRAHAGQGLARIEEHVVRAIRTWRPDVIATSAASPGGDDPVGHLVNQIVLRAAEQAGDADKFPGHADELGLAPCTVKKVAGSLPPGKLGTINVNTSQLAPRLGRSLADYSGAARALVSADYRPGESTWGFRLFLDHVPQGLGQQDFFSGIAPAALADARRSFPARARPAVEAVRQVAERHRNVQAILTHTDRTGQGAAALLAQLGDLTRGLDSATAGEALFELGHAFHHTGRWREAEATFKLLAEKYAGHPRSAAALVWLVQYWSSGEAACRIRRQGGLLPAALAAASGGGPAPSQTLAQVLPTPAALAARGTATPREPPRASLQHDAARDPAQEFGRLLERADPLASADPSVQFPLAAARRQRSESRATDRFHTTLARTRPRDAWGAAARGEEWLAGGRRASGPKPSLRARRTDQRPRLDSQLDDEVWQQAERVELRSALADDAAWPAVAMLAHDDEYLYLALDCRRAPDAPPIDGAGPRTRDPDLSRHDRVEVFLDVDRDFTTFYRLAIDDRGFAADDCWNDATWNPGWFIAAAGAGGTWRAEAAIPLEDLTDRPLAEGTIWALGLQRTLPGVGFQSWSRPAAVEVAPEGFGYLIFD